MKKIKNKLKRAIAGTLAAIVMLSTILTDFSSFNAWGEIEYYPGMTMLSGSENWKFFCIDSYELLGEAGGVQGTNEWYAYVVPSTRLSNDEVAVLFWATLSLRASIGDSIECKGALEKINTNAPAQGLPGIRPTVTEADMKTIIHLKSTRDKYPWMDAVLANEEKYMEMAGLLGGSGNTSMGGKPIPAILQNHKDVSNALTIDSGTFTIPFDASGADKDFIQKVPLEFSSDGGDPWVSAPIGGWTYQKTDTSIIFSNPNPQPPKLMIRFNTKGTEYEVGGGYTSVQDAYDKALQLWICIECNDRHIYHSQKKLPLEAHQRLVYLLPKTVEQHYFAAIAGDPVPGSTGISQGTLEFQVYRHEEDMESTYNVQLYKYDHETGEPLENSVFKLYERFDDQDEIDKEKDGPVHIYEGGEPYKSYHTDNPVTWDGFRFVSGVSTDAGGYASKTINHGYHYDKTFCDGHPAPGFVLVPEEEEEEDEETGEVTVTNEDEIEAAQAENKRLAQAWLSCYAACEAHAAGDFEGVHFHWLMPEVDMGEIESILSTGGSPGEEPNAGKTTSATGEESYRESGCEEDCQQTYDKFISLRYSYAFVESKARDGYIIHDTHADDLPIEVITTDASENGANATFSGEYGKDININDTIKYTLADETLAARERISSYQLSPEEFSTEDTRLTKERKNYLQPAVRFLMPDTATDSNADEWDDIELIDDINGSTATPSNMAATTATPSDSSMATPSDAAYSPQVAFSKSYDGLGTYTDDGEGDPGGGSMFQAAYNTALNGASSGDGIPPGPDGNYSHCNGHDGEGDAWRVYDHRTEGEIHVNKRDMDLEAGEGGGYSSYGDSQGDGTLEGAVYGLFAATDITHPDGKTGVVYKANNLVAVAATDKEGDASFITNTESPGYYYNYDSGKIERTADGWADAAPKNLYVDDISYDDYTVDGQHERIYTDNETNNGNCWIGRPLVLGNYYIKELTRSEGYELSIGNKDNALTNKGQDYNVALPTGDGYASISRGLYAEGQISGNPTGAYGDPDVNELFFSAESRGTGNDGFDIVLSNIPAGARLFRLDTGSEIREVEVGTGVFDKVYLTNEDGSPKYAVAENDYQYPKYNPDGSLMTAERSTDYIASQMLAAREMPLDTAKTQTAIEASEPSMTKEQVAARLALDFSIADKDFIKGKVERALRANGRSTPRTVYNGTPDYSSIYVGVYDAGVREGERDDYGVSGVAPGEPAAKTVYGSPVITLEIPAIDETGTPLKVGDAILSVLDFYNSNSFYDYGGIHDITLDGDTYLATVYASRYGNPANYIVLGSDPVDDSVIYHRVPYMPDDSSESPRYIYATYSNNPGHDAFGTYSDYKGETFGGTYFASARLITDAVATGDGTIATKTITENVYYLAGETPLDESGNPIRAFEYREQTTTTTQEVEINEWTELTVQETDGVAVAHIDSTYTDRYGKPHEDTDLQAYPLRILLPEKGVTLTQDDIDSMYDPADWAAGEEMGSASYYLNVRYAKAKAYLNYADLSAMGDSSYVKGATLSYPGQDYIWQDGEDRPGTNTREKPVPLQERAIKQQIKITKTLDKKSYNNTNPYSEVHEDWWTGLFGSTGQEAGKMENFRFKTYLKSNLMRLYRDEAGAVTWQDRKGNETDILAANEAYPEKVSKIYTRVLHATDPLYKDSGNAVIANSSLYSYTDGLINETQNSGYTAVLETKEYLVDDGTGTRMVQAPNYSKFFDAVAVANNDKWDDAAPTYTSWQPIGNAANRTVGAIENARASDKVRQFATDWYLDDEVRKLVKAVPDGAGETEDADGNVAYTDEMYDAALRAAILKAENYLKPFFAYDIDEIYAIEWDSAADGGSDRDATTLSADTLHGDPDPASGDGYYYGLSGYLPYGTYVVVEQQPRYSSLEDFANKHYQTDSPKEVTLPAAYDSYAGSQSSPETLNSYYNYDAGMAQEEMELRYRIRFNEEDHVIKAHNNYGDFEAYKYGQDIGRITNGVPAAPGAGDYYALTQSEYRPEKNYYNSSDIRSDDGNDYYLAEGQDGRSEVSKYYRYSSVSEDAGTADDVPYPDSPVTEDNPGGISYRDNVRTMSGIQTAYDGKYAPMLVPYTIAAPAGAETEEAEASTGADGESSYVGYGYSKFRNRFYTAKLRIEKLDSETHENILHDGAIFNIYAAKRDDSPDGEGRVLFYGTDTIISGTKEFLESMGAANITPQQRRASWIDRITGKEYGPGNLYTGVVPAGTPICEEPEKIALGDSYGTQTVAFKSYSTVRDGKMKEEERNTGSAYQLQTVGYLETPQPLGAGAYVICEAKPPTGYVRSKPVALEVYSDKVTYYKEGSRDSRVLAALYEYQADNPTVNGNKPQDTVNVARVNVENTPIKLQIEKLKESSAGTANTTPDKTVTYKVSGRIDGKLADIGNNPDYIYAYSDGGDYLGYAWRKGTLEYLAARKAAREQVEIIYDGSTFAGYGYVTRALETADDDNQYVAGATMALYDALEITPTGDTEDHAYEGVVIERNGTNNITRMYVKQGYAGEKVVFAKEKDGEGNEYVTEYQAGVDRHGDPIMVTGNVWSAATIQRPDTDILYYDLDSLAVTMTENVDGRETLYGYDRNFNKVPLSQIEADKANINKTDSEHSIFAFKGGTPYLEFVGGDFTKIKYSPSGKTLEVGEGTQTYHLDRDGNRDSLVDPYTGMAYVREPLPGRKEKTLVWAVNIRKDGHGNTIARDKITTSRIATVGENVDGYAEDVTIDVTDNSGIGIPAEERPSYRHTESGYITGTWRSDAGEESHRESTVNQNTNGQNMNEEALTDDNNGSFEKSLNPAYDRHGLPEYYQRSNETYDKGTDLYDRNGDFVRQQDSDNLEEYNNAAYRINDHEELYDGDETAEGQARKRLYHRLGEGYILENVWTTSDKTPNDPFDDVMTDGQPDVLKRLPAGTYIMEELKAPEGYLKGMPTGISVLETAAMQHTSMVDKTTKEVIDKVDGTDSYIKDVLDMNHRDSTGNPKTIGTAEEAFGAYSHKPVVGAEVTLYPARKVYTAEVPKGYYLVKDGTEPVRYRPTSSTASQPEKITARWTTGGTPVYIEGIPEGYYILEETNTPAGYATSAPVEVEITNTPEVQAITMYDDHTKVEFEKYYLEGTEKKFLSGAGFTLYEAVTGPDGEIVYEDGKPQYHPDRAADSWVSSTGEEYSGFIPAFEEMYRSYGTQPGTSVRWDVDGASRSASFVSAEQTDPSISGGVGSIHPTSAIVTYRTDDGMDIRISVYGGTAGRGGRDFTFDYQFNYKKLPGVNDHAASYLTLEGRHRIDYLPAGMKYVLVEEDPPEGFAKAEDMAVTVTDTGDVQRYHVENVEGVLIISKTAKDRAKELAGAHLGLYRDAGGEFIMDDAYLVTDWITGEDGTYTELDYINNRIPDGYAQGDLKPHYIRQLPTGAYWLAEIKSPGYYTTFQPVKIDYRQEDEIRIIRATDIPAEGDVEIRKTDDGGTPLAGAVFELSAYKASDLRNPVLTRTLSSLTGTIKATGLPVGEVQEDGHIEPYTYKLKETVPPDGYAVNTQIFKWQFTPDRLGVSYTFGEAAAEEIQVTNQKTKVKIGKKDFDSLGDDATDGAFIVGAKFALYEILGRDGHDRLIYDKDNPFVEWTTTEESRFHEIEGLVAGRSYYLVETQAPAGFNVMKPVILTMSSDGRKISGISNQVNTIKANYITLADTGLDTDSLDMDSIQSVTIKGRYVSKVIYTVTDGAGSTIGRWAASGTAHTLYASDGFEDGNTYTITEKTVYSDGTEAVTDRWTRPLFFDADGTCTIPVRTAERVTLALDHADGTAIDSFSPSELVQEHTVQNNVSPENPKVTMKNRNGQPGDALNPNAAVFNTVSFANTSNITSDMEIIVRPGTGTTIIDPGDGIMDGGRLVFTARDIKPLEGGYVSFATEVHGLESSLTVTLKHNGKTAVTTKTVPVLQPNQLTIYNELTGSGKLLYADEENDFEVRLYTAEGEELKGSYRYRGSKDGVIRSGGSVRLAGNEYITIDPDIYKGIQYKVTRKEDGKEFTAWGEEGSAPEASGSCAVFTRHVPDTSEREIFRKGGSYILAEVTEYSDGTVLESNKLQIALDGQASVDTIIGTDKKTKAVISKIAITGTGEQPGNHMNIETLDGTVIISWVSGTEPYLIEGLLEPGVTYRLRETEPAPGQSYSRDILFAVNGDGTVDRVTMVNKPTHVIISKKMITGENELPGNLMSVKDKDGNAVVSWVSGTEPYEIIGILTAGETYTLTEKRPADGFAYATEIEFTVSLDGTVDWVEMRNEETKLEVRKLATGSNAEPIEGAVLQILNEDKTPATATNDTEYFKKGQELIFGSKTDFVHIVRQLAAGQNYWLHEVTPAPGYAFADDVPFTASLDGSQDVVTMFDKPTHVVVSKKSITGEDELPGNLMGIKDSEGREIISWISGEEPFEIVATLLAEGTYTLYEIRPKDGYAYADEVTFTVSRDGSIDQVTMVNTPTQIFIQKIDAKTKKPLPGIRFEIRDIYGKIFDEWISGEEPYEITGKLPAGETFYAHEVEPLPGYLPVKPVEFTVPHGPEPLYLNIENRKPSNPDTPDTPGPSDRYITFRKTGDDGQFLAGAKFAFYYADGSLYTEAVSDSSGTIRISLPPDGTYTYQEVAPPEGYLLNTEVYSFTVRDGKANIAIKNITNRKVPEIIVEKKDTANGKLLSGATIRIWDDFGYAFTGVTGSDGLIRFTPDRIGKHYIQETAAPEGYHLNDTVYEFTLHQDGSVSGTTTIYNDAEGKKIGRVYASYSSRLKGKGFSSFGSEGRIIPGLAKTGDESTFFLWLMLILSLSGLIAMNRQKIFRKREGGIIIIKKKAALKSAIMILIAIAFAWICIQIFFPLRIYASEGSETTTIWKTSEPFVDSPENHLPENTIELDGKTYHLQNYEVVETVIEEKTVRAGDTITYGAVEQIDKIPAVAEVEILNEDTGAVVKKTVPLKEYEYTDYRWVNGFSFPITVEDADADYFALDDSLIPNREDSPFSGYETALLNYIGVSPDAYQIDSVEWQSDPWVENGIVYRQATAYGKKLVANVTATYEGMVTIDSYKANTVHAAYKFIEAAPTEEAVPEQPEEEEDTGKTWWDHFLEILKWLLDFLTSAVGVTLCILIFIFMVILIFFYLRKKKEENNDDINPKKGGTSS